MLLVAVAVEAANAVLLVAVVVTAEAVGAAPVVLLVAVVVEAANAVLLVAVAVEVANAVLLVAVAVEAANAVLLVAVAEGNIHKPKLSTSLLHFEKAGKHLFFAPDIPDWIVVNQNSAILLFSCDGIRSEEEIFSSFDLHGQIREDVLRLFQLALSRGILQGNRPKTTMQPPTMRDNPAKVGKGSLGSVHIKLTNECNLRCKYCYASSGKSSGIMSLDVLRRISKEVAEISEPVEYLLSGGEPLLHPDALTFAEVASNAGNAVHLLTNGMLIDNNDTARRISATTKIVKISVDGSTEAVHALSRGKGNLDAINKAIDLLDHHGANVMVSMTVSKKNAHDIANMSAKYGARLTLQPLFKAGRGKGKTNQALTGEEYYRAMDEVDGIAPMGRVAQVVEGLRGRGVKKCALADREISISETGDVYPCQLLYAPEFLAGNIHQSALKDIYFTSPVLEKMRSVNVDTLDECSKCPIRLLCAGGCRARDYYESGSVETVGEFCEYEKLALINGILDSSAFDA